MKAGDIVLVDWRDAIPGSLEPNKVRPAVVVGSPPYFGSALAFEIVVPLTGESELATVGASIAIPPTRENGCVKESYAISWLVQSVPHVRISETSSYLTPDQVQEIRSQIAVCVGVT